MKSIYRFPAAPGAAAALCGRQILLFCFLLTAYHVTALNYYWVNGSGAWSQFATHWAKIPNPAVAADYHANVPTSMDDVYFTSNGSMAYTVNVDAGSTVPKCRNMDWTGVPAGTVWGGGGGRLDIYGSTTLDANMSIAYTGEVHFIAFGLVSTILSDGVIFPGNVFFEGTMGGWSLSDGLIIYGSCTHTAGALTTNGHTVYGGYFYGVSPGSLNLGDSDFYVQATLARFHYEPVDFNAGTSHIICNSASLEGNYTSATRTHFYDVSFFGSSGNGFAWGSVDGTLTFHGFGRIHSYLLQNVSPPVLNNVIFEEDGLIYNANNYNKLTFTAGKTYTIQDYSGTTGTDQSILPGGSLTAMGAGTCSEFITIKSWQYGTAVKFVNNSGTDIMTGCIILEDVHADGTNNLTVNDGVDLGNNTGWIFVNPNPGLDLYWVGGAGDWNDPCHWTDDPLSLVGDCGCLPNGASNVHFTANSGFTANPGSVTTAPVAYCKDMDWTGVTGAPVLDISYSSLNIYGSTTLAPVGQMSVATYSDGINMRASGAATITSNGQYLHTLVLFQGSGKWDFLDAYHSLYVTHIRGEINTKGNPVSFHTWYGNNSYPTGLMSNNGAILRLGDPGGSSSTVNISSQFYCQYEPGNFFTEQSHLIFSDGAQLISHPFSHWDVTFTGDGYSNAPSCNFHQMTIAKDGKLTGDQTFEKLSVTGGYSYLLQNSLGTGNTITITPSGIFEVLNGSCENRAYFHVDNPVEFGYFEKTSGNLTLDWVTLDNILPVATGATYSATNSIAIQTATATAWGITNPTPRNLFWVGGDGNWHDSNHWSLASSGSGGQCPPTQVDNVRFDGSSGFLPGDKVNVQFTNAFCKTMDWTGAPGYQQLFSPYSGDPTQGHHLYIFGDLTLAPNVTNYGGTWVFMANQPSTIFSAGNRLRNWVRFWEEDGDWTLLDDFSVWIDVLHEYGTIRTAPGADISVGRFWNGNPHVLPDTELWLGNSNMFLKGDCCADGGTGLFFYHTNKFHAGTSNIVLERGGYINTTQHQYQSQPIEFNNITFKEGGQSLYGGRISGKLTFENSGSIISRLGDLPEWNYVHEAQLLGDVSFSGPRDFHILQFTPGHRYTFEAGRTVTIVPHNGIEGQFIAQGLPGQYIEMKSSNPSVPATIHMDDYNGTSTCTKYLFLTGMTHTGTEDIYVPTPGGNVFNNSGWQFFPCNPCPASIPVLAANSITVGCAPGKARLILDGLKPDEWAIWYSDPAATTNIVYNGGTTGPAGNLFEPLITGPATYYARVYSDGGLCESTVILTVNITTIAPPVAFNVTGGGMVCTGSVGTPIGLDGSAVGVSYQLQINGVDVGSPVNGTGAPILFGNQTAAGTYTVVATITGTGCPADMNGSAVVTGNPLFAPAVVASSNAPLCVGSGNLQLFETGGAPIVSWMWTGPNGYTALQQNPVIASPSVNQSGLYTVKVTDANGCTNVGGVNAVVHPQPPTPILDPASVILVQQGQSATLILQNLPAGYEAVWYAADQTTVLYADVANLFQPVMNQAGTFYGAVREMGTGCVSGVIEVKVLAYAPLTARVEAYNASCSDANDGSAQAIVNGGRQSIGTGHYKESEERYGFYGFRITMADFNGDAYPDIYESTYGGSDNLWLNDGDGTYTYQFSDYNSIKSSPRSVAGDFDGDGDEDLYVCNTIANSDKILINNGVGVFTELPQSYGLSGSQGAQAGDVNGDGKLDVVIVGNAFAVVLLGNGDGTFNQQANFGNVSYHSRGVDLADLDGDGDLDAFVVNGAGPGATLFPPDPDKVYLNDGSGNFTEVAEDYGTNEAGWDVELQDLDGDGDKDAFVANWNAESSQVYFNDGDGTFTVSPQTFPAWETRNVSLGDMDRDGDVDAMVANFPYYNGTGSASVRQLLNDGSGRFTLDPVIYPEATDVAVGDIDRDGDLDVFSCNTYTTPWTGLHHILFNDDNSVIPYQYQWSGGSQVYSPDIRSDLSKGNYSVTATDSEGNIATSNFQIYANEPIALIANSTSASCSNAMNGTATVNISGGAPFKLTYDNQRIGNAAEATIVLADFDNDNDLDVLAGLYNRVLGINNGSGVFTDISEPTLPVGCYAIAVGNLDGDSNKDILAASVNGNQFGFYKSNGNLTFQAPVLYTVTGAGYLNSIRLADLNNDGSLDAFIGDEVGRPDMVWLNDGNGGFTQTTQLLGSEDTYNVELGDLDGDGDMDALSLNLGDGDVVYINNGSGLFTQHFTFPAGIASTGAALGDIDGDGDLDAVVECYGLQTTRVYFNNGDATFTIGTQQIPNMGANRDVNLGDLDGDGDLDIVYQKDRNLAPGQHGGEIWLNDGSGYFIEYRHNHTLQFVNLSYPLSLGDLDGDNDLDIVVNGGDGVALIFNSPVTYTYHWSNGQTTPMAVGLAPGNYQVTATDFRGCQAETSVTIGNLGNQPPVLPSSNAPFCAGSNNLQLFETGGAQGISWMWTGPNGYTSTQQNPVIVNPSEARSGTYTVKVTDANGCTNETTLNVEIHPVPTMIDIPADLLICSGSTVTQYYQTDDPFTYYLGTVNGLNAGPNAFNGIANYYIPDLVPEVKNLSVTPVHNYNGLTCTGLTHFFTITVMPYPEPYAPANQVFCANESAPLTVLTGRLSTAYYTWTNDNPAIGLPASGNGNIPAFTALNGGSTPVTANIRIRGHYDYGNITCMDTAITRFRITVNPLPTMVCPPNLFIGLADPAFPLAGAAPTGGAYTGPGVANGLFDPLAAGLGIHLMTYNYADANNCPGTCSFTITVQNLAPPTIICPTNIVQSNASGQCGTVVNYPLPTATAPLGIPTLTILSGLPAGGFFPVGTTVLIWQATGSSGLTATCSFTVMVNDGQNPTLVCPANIVRNTDPGQCSSVVNYTMTTVNDNCPGWSLVRTSGLPSGSAFPKGITMVNWKVTDAAGNMAVCGFTITVNDNQTPTIVCPPDIVRSTGPNSCYSAAVFYAVKGLADNCPGVTGAFLGSQPTTGLPSGSTFPKGVTIITLKATDAAGGMKTCSFSVTVNDAQPPAITCPANIVLNTAVNLCTAVATYTTPTFTDNCVGGGVAIQSGLASGSAFPKGITTVVWKATDSAGLTKTCTFKVTVNDVQAPLITCPASMSMPTSPGQCGALAVTYTMPTFTDNCAGTILARTGGQASGAAFPAGATPVTWKATDAAGNFSVCTFTVTVTDAQPPSIVCPPNMARNMDLNHCSAVVTYPQPTAMDNCAGATGFLFAGLASGSEFPLGATINVWRAFDLAGLSNTCSFAVTVSDAQVPAMTCPPNTTVNASGNPCGWSSSQLTLPTASDNCAVTLLTSNVTASLPPGATVVIWTAKDASNNAKTCSQTVTVECGTGVSSSKFEVRSLKLGQGLGLVLAPNPASAQVNVVVTGGGEQGELAVFDPLGRMVWKQRLADLPTQELMLDVSGPEFPAGMYQVRLQTAAGSLSKGLVVVKL